MKKVIIFITATFLLLTFTQLKAGNAPTPADSAKAAQSVAVNTLRIRLNEIKTMDKSKLGSSERKQLKKEVRQIKSHIKELGGGVYISIGALLLVILLLILLL